MNAGAGIAAPSAAADAVIWHDVECGGYAADLALWSELAAERDGPLLELGSGTGRVALALAAAGAEVTAVDTDARLIEALNARAAARSLPARGFVADARAVEPAGEFGLIVAPMQLVQLLSGPGDRGALMRSSRERLAPGGVLALAIVEGTPVAARRDDGQAPPAPDVAEHEGWVYSSLPLGVEPDGERLVIRRLRQRVAPGGSMDDALDETSLAVLDAAVLEAEALAAGLRACGRRLVPTTDDHIGSTVVVLEAS